MKQPTLPERFTTDKPMVNDRIYLIQQGTEKKCVSVWSAVRMNLKGKWKIIKEFEK